MVAEWEDDQLELQANMNNSEDWIKNAKSNPLVNFATRLVPLTKGTYYLYLFVFIYILGKGYSFNFIYSRPKSEEAHVVGLATLIDELMRDSFWNVNFFFFQHFNRKIKEREDYTD